MKRFLLIIFLFYALISSLHGAVLRGKIVWLNKGGKPVPNVQLSAFGTNAQVSTSSGLFELDFPEKKPGDVIALIVNKKGFEVINKKELERVILRQNPDELLEIVMCLEGEWEENAKNYYNIAAKSINDEYLKKLKLIETEIIKGKENEIKRLKEEKNQALVDAKKMAEEFAQTNLDEASKLYKEAFEYFTKGNIDKALVILKKEKLDKELKKIQDAERKAKEARSQLAMDYILGARLLKIKLRFDEVESYYDNAIKADPENINDYWEFSEFLWKQKRFKKFEEICGTALSIKMNDGNKAAFLNNLGLLYSDTQRQSKAEKMYEEALEIRRRLSESNPDAYLMDVSMSLNNLGTLYYSTQRLSEAEKVYVESLEIYRRLSKSNPDTYLPFVATSLNNLGLLYSDTQRLSEAEKVYVEALEIRRRLSDINPDAYLPFVATSLNNLGILYKVTQRLNEAEKVYVEALEIRRRLSESNSEAYLPDLATSLNNLGLFYIPIENYPKAFFHFIEALKIREKLVDSNSQAFGIDICQTIISLIMLYQKAPDVCKEIENNIPKLLERTISILKSFPDNPKAKELLDLILELKKIISID